MATKNKISEAQLKSEYKNANELTADIIDLVRSKGAHESSFALATASALVLLNFGIDFNQYCELIKELMEDFENYEKKNLFFN